MCYRSGEYKLDTIKRATRRVATLQDKKRYVDTLDATRLANEYRRVPGLLERFSTVEEFERFYENATSYERRALQKIRLT